MRQSSCAIVTSSNLSIGAPPAVEDAEEREGHQDERKRDAGRRVHAVGGHQPLHQERQGGDFRRGEERDDAKIAQ